MMLVVQVLLLLALLSETVHMAPVLVVEEEKVDTDPASEQCELDQLLTVLLLNDTENLDKIKKAFSTTPSGEAKVCGQLNYQEECEDAVDCSTGNSFVVTWTTLHTSTWSKELFLWIASFHWEIFGFEWGGTGCDLTTGNAPVLNINVSSLQHCRGVDWNNITKSLLCLTEKVR